MERNHFNPEKGEWLGKNAGDPEHQWKLNASSDHLDEEEADEETDDENTDWGHVDPLDDGGTSDTDPSGPGSAV